MTAPALSAAAPGGARTSAPTRERWRMSPEALALVVVTASLQVFGLGVLYSASALQAVAAGSPGHHFVLRQALGVLVGVVCFMVAAKVDADRWRPLAWPLMGLSFLLMLVIILPGTESISGRMYGSRRYLFGGSIQPSEIAKFAILVWTPMLLVKKGTGLHRFSNGMLPFAVVIGALCVLAVLEPDLSVAAMFCLLMAVLLFVGGAKLRHFLLFALLGVAGIGAHATQSRYVRARIEGFLVGEAAGKTERAAVNDQQYQSLVAVGSGGVLGVGFGQGNQQRGWLPLAYNDFIGSIIGEEFGFLGMVFTIVAFAAYGWLGFRIARHARSAYGTLLAIGLTFTTVFTAFVHLGVVVRLFPNTGLTLPFVSYGRSNLVLTLLMTGILVNIGSARERVYGASATDPLGR